MTSPELSTTVVDGRSLAWREAGRGPAIVLLHDICADSTAWAPQFGGLAKDYRVVAWDCPGFGGSALLPQREPAAADYADALGALLAHLKIDRAAVVGAGLGAVVATSFAAKRGTAVGALALVGAQAKIGGAEAARMLGWLQDLVRDPAAFGLTYADTALPRGCEPPVRAHVAAMAASMAPIGFGRACQMLAGANLAEQLKSVHAPLLLLYGDLDPIAPPEAGTLLDMIVRGTVTEIVEQAGHMPQLETPEPFHRALRTFLRAARSRA
ncbi:pimeloyl-ACP methyl ester carboxylesterase [Constrictibacter sp. MBR-5]|jgi:pimeloyl-ACP methyl ester carboxylesterase|uniref:alpha/beta fold hydrolase n=1 Tax=Constrictibacter sp. MBR-5 TaxID=3156467 RepID=UPI003390ECE3